MGTLQLIKEVNLNGETYYWSTYNGERVTPYTTYEDRAIQDFNNFTPIEPSKEVIKTKEM